MRRRYAGQKIRLFQEFTSVYLISGDGGLNLPSATRRCSSFLLPIAHLL